MTLEDERVRFTHPLLASLCYEQAPPWKRRAVHARLATLVEDPEERARHLALAADGRRRGAGRGARRRRRARRGARRDGGGRRAGRARRAAHPARGCGRGDAAGGSPRPSSIISPGTSGGRRSCSPRSPMSFRPGSSAPTCSTRALDRARRPPHPRAPGRAGAARGRRRRSLAARRSSASWRSTGWLSWAASRRGCATLARGLRAPSAWAIRASWRWRSHALGFMETLAADVTPGLLERGAEIEASLDEPLLFIESPSFMLAVTLMSTTSWTVHGRCWRASYRSAVERGDEHTRQLAILQLIIVEGLRGSLAARARARRRGARHRGADPRGAIPRDGRHSRARPSRPT